jgi:hypothetical protein
MNNFRCKYLISSDLCFVIKIKQQFPVWKDKKAND